jgi:hypothetical protein
MTNAKPKDHPMTNDDFRERIDEIADVLARFPVRDFAGVARGEHDLDILRRREAARAVLALIEPTDLSADYIAKIKRTLAVDIGRFMTAGLPPKAIVDKLWDIPEVEQAFYLRSIAVRKQGKWTLPENEG